MSETFTPPITAREIIRLYGKHGLKWAQDFYLGTNLEGFFNAACATGICYYDVVTSTLTDVYAEASEDVGDSDMDAILQWPAPFMQGVIAGNDGESNLAHRYPIPVQAEMYRIGWEIGTEVRDHFIT